MTIKDRTKTLSRRLQAATGKPYATCRQQIEEWDATSTPEWDSAAAWLTDQEILALASEVGATIGSDHVRVKYEHLNHGVYAVLITSPHYPAFGRTSTGIGAARLELSGLDGYLGYVWFSDDHPHTVGNFLHADGTGVTNESLQRHHDATLPGLRDAITWLATQFAAHPDRYDDTGRPATLEAPIYQ